jgi:replication factor A1
MISMPPERVRERLKSQAGLSDADIDARVEEKMKSLAGLISKDGALHIVANELGVKLMPEREELRVKDLLPGMRVQLNLKVLKAYELRTFNREGREGQVASFLAGDETGVVRVALWNEHAPNIEKLAEGTIVQVRDATARENQGRIELSIGTGANVIISPPGVKVEVNASAAVGGDRSYTKKKISELGNADEYVDILGTIVQVYDPRTFVKKSGEQGMVANIVVDDGSGTIRAAFWDNDCKELLGEAATKTDMLPDVKLELLGQIVKVQGRCKLNPTYNQVELSVSNFVKNPDPAAEMDRVSA